MQSHTTRIGRTGGAAALCAGLALFCCAGPQGPGGAETAAEKRAPERSGARSRIAARPSATGVPADSSGDAADGVGGAAWSRLLPWGAGPGQAGLRPAAPEFVPEGPSAVAVGPGGEVYVLDRLNGRVLRVTRGGASVAAGVPRDAEDLAAGADGVLAAYSPLRARVFLRETTRAACAGEVAVPRELRLARGVLLGPSRQVLVHTAHQEVYRVGSPAVPLDLAAVLRSKREGARLLPDGRGLAVQRHADGRAELLLLGAGERAPVERRLGIPGPVLAARVMGLEGGVACLRLERPRADHGPRISVARELYCLEAVSGAVLLRRDLPAPAGGQALPRRELALGGAPLRVAFLSPQPEGLRVEVWPVPAAGRRGAEVRP